MLGFGMAIGLTDNFSRTANTVIGSFNRLDNASASLSGKINSHFSKMQSGMALTGIGASIVAPFGLAVNKAMDFEAQMSNVKAISGATGVQFDALKNKAKELGATTAFSATQAGEAFEELVKAGYDTDQSLNSVSATMNMAGASGITMSDAASVMTDTIATFGLMSKDAQMVGDVLAKGANSASTNIPLIAESIKYAAPMVQSLGTDIQETTAMIGLLANTNYKGSVATATLSTAMGRLATPKMQEYLKGVGVEMFNNQGKFLGMANLIREVDDATISMTDQQKLAFFKKSFGTAAGQMQALMKSTVKASINGKDVILEGADAYEYLTKQMHNANGTGKQLAKTKLDNLKGDITILGSAVEGLAISTGEILIPAMRSGVQMVTGFVNKFNAFAQTPAGEIVVKVAVGVGTLATALGVGVTAFHGYRIAVLTTTPFLESLGKSVNGAISSVRNLGVQMLRMVGITNIAGGSFMGAVAPFAAVAVPIIAVGTAIYGLYKSWQSFDNLLKTGDSYGDNMIFQFAEGGIAQRLQQVGGVIRGVWEIIKSANSEGFSMPNNVYQALQGLGVADFVLSIGTYVTRFHGFMKGIGQGASELLSVFSPLGKVFSDLGGSIAKSFGAIGGEFGKAETPMQSFIDAGKSIAIALKPPLEIVAGVIGGVVKGVIWLNDTFDIVGNTIRFVKGVIGGIGTVLSRAFSGAYQIVSPLLTAFSELGTAISDGLKTINMDFGTSGNSMMNFSAIGTLIGDTMKLVMTGIVTATTWVIDGIVWLNQETGFVSTTIQGLATVAGIAIEGLMYMGRTVMTLGSTFVSVFGVIGTEIQNFKNGMTTLPEMFWNIGTGIVTNLWNGFKSIFADFAKFVVTSIAKIPGVEMLMEKMGVDMSQFTTVGKIDPVKQAVAQQGIFTQQKQSNVSGFGFHVPDNAMQLNRGEVQLSHPESQNPAQHTREIREREFERQTMIYNQNAQPANINVESPKVENHITVKLDTDELASQVIDKQELENARSYER